MDSIARPKHPLFSAFIPYFTPVAFSLSVHRSEPWKSTIKVGMVSGLRQDKGAMLKFSIIGLLACLLIGCPGFGDRILGDSEMPEVTYESHVKALWPISASIVTVPLSKWRTAPI